MLQTQVNYWTNVENKRSHLANEAIQWAQTEEQQRHNLNMESLNAATLAEQQRHSLVTEKQGQSSVNIARKQMQEQRRADKVRESIQRKELIETRRHAKVSENLQKESNTIGFQNVSLGYSNLAESTRSHKANESLSGYANWTNRYVGTQNAQSQRISAQASQSNASTRKEELDWNKTQYLDYEYDLARKKLVQGYVNTGANTLVNLTDSILSFVTKRHR